jgi:hypothetical protein
MDGGEPTYLEEILAFLTKHNIRRTPDDVEDGTSNAWKERSFQIQFLWKVRIYRGSRMQDTCFAPGPKY